ncbi:MAG: holo-ACP synthase [Pantoea sp. Brub]|nr:holo-ACP synthase [Pantoea sp. Brub]
MTILGLGIDIVEVERIYYLIKKFGDRFTQRILTNSEKQQYDINQQPERFLAKRFAVKEAAAKALGTGISNGLAFNQIQIYNDELGKPGLLFFKHARKIAKHLNIKNVHISLTDEKYYACAVVIIEN